MPSTRAQTCLTLSHPPSPYRRTSTAQIDGHHRHSVRRGPRFPSFLIATQVTSEHSKGYIERNARRLLGIVRHPEYNGGCLPEGIAALADELNIHLMV